VNIETIAEIVGMRAFLKLFRDLLAEMDANLSLSLSLSLFLSLSLSLSLSLFLFDAFYCCLVDEDIEKAMYMQNKNFVSIYISLQPRVPLSLFKISAQISRGSQTF